MRFVEEDSVLNETFQTRLKPPLPIRYSYLKRCLRDFGFVFEEQFVPIWNYLHCEISFKDKHLGKDTVNIIKINL
jgi:hypothetical protein